MAKIRFRTTIQRDRETIYKLLSDLRGYKSWLPASNLYNETTEISEGPIRVGTHYVDKGTNSAMQGSITELQPYQYIAFEQDLQRKLAGIQSAMRVQTRYTLEQAGNNTTLVTRDSTLKTSGIFLLLQPVLLQAIRKENERIVQRLKWYLEAR